VLENQLVTLATTIESYWQPIKTWSQIALLLSKEGVYLAAILSTLLATILFLYVFETRKQRKANAKAYKKLSKPNKHIIDTVMETQKNTTPTTNAIAARYKDIIGKPIEEKNLLHLLWEAEKTGIIKSGVASVHDEPTRIWKKQIDLHCKAMSAHDYLCVILLK